MTTETILYIILGIFILWFLIGLWNNKRFKKELEIYSHKYEYYRSMEKNSSSIEDKTNFFLKKEALMNDFPRLFSIRKDLEKIADKKKYFRRILLQFILLGPIYNIR